MNPHKIDIRQVIEDYKKIREMLEIFVSECKESEKKNEID